MSNSVFFRSLNGTAGTTELSASVDVKNIKLLINDSVNAITFGFDIAYASNDDKVVLNAGEKLTNIDIPVKTLYYKGAADNSTFRFMGEKKRD